METKTPWWAKNSSTSVQAVIENPALMTPLEKLIRTRMGVWMREMDSLQPEPIVDDLRRFCERYAGTPEWAGAIAVARGLELA